MIKKRDHEKTDKEMQSMKQVRKKRNRSIAAKASIFQPAASHESSDEDTIS